MSGLLFFTLFEVDNIVWCAHRIVSMSAQVEQLLNVGDTYNSRLWPALVNPTPLLKLPMPNYSSQHSTEEVQIALENTLPSWKETPGAMQMLVDRVGTHPKYDCKRMKF